MINRIKIWINGYVDACIAGQEKERFITLCKNNGIYIFNIRKDDKKLYFSVDLKTYKHIKKIVRKTHIIPRIQDKCGLPFLYSKYKNRQSFMVGILLGIFLFYIASMYVWAIQVEGENYYTDSEIIRFLKSNGIYTGIKVKDVECNKIERLIRGNYNDIGWVSVKVEGTNMVISIKENVKYKIENDSDKGRHMIASENAVIKSIYVEKGESILNKGMEVKKGDIIISGICDIKDDGGNIIEKKAVKAEGNVILKYDKEYNYELKREYIKRVYTNKKRSTYKLWWNKKEIININLYQLFPKKFDNYDVIVNNYNVIVGKNLYTPIIAIKENKYEYNNKKCKYTDKELKYKAHNFYKRYVAKLKDDNKNVADNFIKYDIDKHGICAKGYITIEEKINTYKGIQDNEMLVETKNKENDNGYF